MGNASAVATKRKTRLAVNSRRSEPRANVRPRPWVGGTSRFRINVCQTIRTRCGSLDAVASSEIQQSVLIVSISCLYDAPHHRARERRDETSHGGVIPELERGDSPGDQPNRGGADAKEPSARSTDGGSDSDSRAQGLGQHKGHSSMEGCTVWTWSSTLASSSSGSSKNTDRRKRSSLWRTSQHRTSNFTPPRSSHSRS